jgi:hypothetical protein
MDERDHEKSQDTRSQSTDVRDQKKCNAGSSERAAKPILTYMCRERGSGKGAILYVGKCRVVVVLDFCASAGTVRTRHLISSFAGKRSLCVFSYLDIAFCVHHGTGDASRELMVQPVYMSHVMFESKGRVGLYLVT